MIRLATLLRFVRNRWHYACKRYKCSTKSTMTLKIVRTLLIQGILLQLDIHLARLEIPTRPLWNCFRHNWSRLKNLTRCFSQNWSRLRYLTRPFRPNWEDLWTTWRTSKREEILWKIWTISCWYFFCCMTNSARKFRSTVREVACVVSLRSMDPATKFCAG